MLVYQRVHLNTGGTGVSYYLRGLVVWPSYLTVVTVPKTQTVSGITSKPLVIGLWKPLPAIYFADENHDFQYFA
jgi:hypothetical protein